MGDGAIGGITSSVEIMHPAMARWLRDNCHFERQRNIASTNVERIAREMEMGRFIPGMQLYLAVLPDGSEKILNGNHSLEAIVKSGVSQTMTVTKVMVRDLDAAGAIYAVFDIQKIRTWRDSARALTDIVPAELDLRALAAIGFIERNWGSLSSYDVNKGRLDRIQSLEKYRSALDFYPSIIADISVETRKYMVRAPIMAVALATLRYQPSGATEFWSAVAADNGLQKGDPAKALLQFLRNLVGVTGNATQRYQSRAAAAAWNAFWRGDRVGYIKPGLMTAFTLLGTPWHTVVKTKKSMDIHDLKLGRRVSKMVPAGGTAAP